MIPEIGQKVRLSNELLSWAQGVSIEASKHKHLLQFDGQWGTVIETQSKNKLTLVLVRFRIGTLKAHASIVVNRAGLCDVELDGSLMVRPFTCEPLGDPCPKCGRRGELVPMACVCRTPGCAQGVIWGI